MHHVLVVILALSWCVIPSVSAEVASSALKGRARKSAMKAVGLIGRTSATFLEKRECFTCHTQTFAALVLTDAKKAGFVIDDQNLTAQIDRAYEIFDSLGGVRPDTVGHALLTLEIGNRTPNRKTEAMLRYLLDYGNDSGPWKVAIENREPAEASDFTTNYLALRATNRFGTAALKEEIAVRRRAVESWIATVEANDTEDQVFRLLLANELGYSSEQKEPFVRRLLDEQTHGGGWAQKNGMQPDAYATGSTLVAMHKAGGISPQHRQWLRGVEYLVNTQLPDGSWHVASRVKPVQDYFESGFPHGKDQFISAFATGWSTEALLILLLPKQSNTLRAP